VFDEYTDEYKVQKVIQRDAKGLLILTNERAAMSIEYKRSFQETPRGR